MKIRTTMAAIGALLLFAAPALADPILGIRLSESGFGTVTQTSPTSPLIFNGTYGTFSGNVETNALHLTPTTTTLDLASTNISTSTAGTLVITASASGLTGPIGLAQFLSQFTGSWDIATPGTTAELQTYYNASNTLFGTSTLLSTFVSGATPFAFSNTIPENTVSPFALTEVLTLTATGAMTTFSTDSQLTGTCPNPGTPGCGFNPPTDVPEPTSLAILGTALAGLGIMRWRRRRQSA